MTILLTLFLEQANITIASNFLIFWQSLEQSFIKFYKQDSNFLSKSLDLVICMIHFKKQQSHRHYFSYPLKGLAECFTHRHEKKIESTI